VGAFSGNASLRLPASEGQLLVTPTHNSYYGLKPEELVVVDLAGQPLSAGRKPSSETPLHLEIYRQRPDVMAVVHTHSRYASAAAVAGREIPPIIDEMVSSIGGAVRLAEYTMPGTADLGRAACRALGSHQAALLRNHGVVGVGAGIWEALEVCDLVERVAQIFVLAQVFGSGSATPLAPDIIERQLALLRQRRSAG